MVLALVAACGDESESNGGTSCEAICKRIEEPNCSNAAPDCIEACEDDNAATPKACEKQLSELTSCFSKVKFQCDEDDYPEARGCVYELDEWLECRQEHAFEDLE